MYANSSCYSPSEEPERQSVEALAFLKAQLLAEGVRLSPTISSDDFQRPFYSIVTQGIELDLFNCVTANVFINPASGVVLRRIEQHLELSVAGRRYATSVGEPSQALSQTVPGTDLPVSDFCYIATDRINIWAVESCAMVVQKTPCKFCDVACEGRPYLRQNLDNIRHALNVLIKEIGVSARHVQVSGGTPLKGDWGHFLNVCEVAVETGRPVSVMTSPWTPYAVLEALQRIGVSELALNVEFSSEYFRRELTPGKQGDCWERLAKIATMWPEKSIRSALIVGLEPEKDTIEGVRKLLARGVVPMLSPFRPAPGTPMADVKAPTAEQLYGVFMRSLDEASKHGLFIGPSCRHCQHNVMALPLELI